MSIGSSDQSPLQDTTTSAPNNRNLLTSESGQDDESGALPSSPLASPSTSFEGNSLRQGNSKPRAKASSPIYGHVKGVFRGADTSHGILNALFIGLSDMKFRCPPNALCTVTTSVE